jgi:protein PhnA
MSLENILLDRSNSKCELCLAESHLKTYSLEVTNNELDTVLICESCDEKIASTQLDTTEWFFLRESIWSEYSGVKLVSYYLLNRLDPESWVRETIDQSYLTDEELALFKEMKLSGESSTFCKDAHGNILNDGDMVTLIKDLNVKGAGFVAKRGTVVKQISLTDNPEHIEGKVNGMRIVLLAKYLKRA